MKTAREQELEEALRSMLYQFAYPGKENTHAVYSIYVKK